MSVLSIKAVKTSYGTSDVKLSIKRDGCFRARVDRRTVGAVSSGGDGRACSLSTALGAVCAGALVVAGVVSVVETGWSTGSDAAAVSPSEGILGCSNSLVGFGTVPLLVGLALSAVAVTSFWMKWHFSCQSDLGGWPP
jgi:hypothetical protein